MAAAVTAVVALRVAGFGASAMAARHAWAVVLVYAVPLLGVAASLTAIYGPPFDRYVRAPNLRLLRLPMVAR